MAPSNNAPAVRARLAAHATAGATRRAEERRSLAAAYISKKIN
jgi:hypothetical protein